MIILISFDAIVGNTDQLKNLFTTLVNNGHKVGILSSKDNVDEIFALLDHIQLDLEIHKEIVIIAFKPSDYNTDKNFHIFSALQKLKAGEHEKVLFVDPEEKNTKAAIKNGYYIIQANNKGSHVDDIIKFINSDKAQQQKTSVIPAETHQKEMTVIKNLGNKGTWISDARNAEPIKVAKIKQAQKKEKTQASKPSDTSTAKKRTSDNNNSSSPPKKARFDTTEALSFSSLGVVDLSKEEAPIQNPVPVALPVYEAPQPQYYAAPVALPAYQALQPQYYTAPVALPVYQALQPQYYTAPVALPVYQAPQQLQPQYYTAPVALPVYQALQPQYYTAPVALPVYQAPQQLQPQYYPPLFATSMPTAPQTTTFNTAPISNSNSAYDVHRTGNLGPQQYDMRHHSFYGQNREMQTHTVPNAQSIHNRVEQEANLEMFPLFFETGKFSLPAPDAPHLNNNLTSSRPIQQEENRLPSVNEMLENLTKLTNF